MKFSIFNFQFSINFKYSIIIIFTILFLALLSLAALGSLRNAIPANNHNNKYVKINDNKIFVEIADTREKQIQGLSERPSLEANEGMLFIFPNKQVRNFWMKNMNFPIDIVWLDNDKVANISKNLTPEGESPSKTYSSVVPVNNVLEINTGVADQYGLKAGDTIKIKL